MRPTVPRSAATAAALVLAAAGLAQSPRPPAARVFTGATVVDASGAAPLAGATIVVADGRIAAIGPRAEVAIPAGAAPPIDLAGKWVVPGYVDARVHLSRTGSLYARPDLVDLRDIVPDEEELAAARRRIDAALARFLACGVTSVADAGGPVTTYEARDRASRLEAAPRVAVCGEILSARAAPAALASDAAPPIVAVDTPDEARDFVRKALVRGPDFMTIEFPFWPENDIADYEPIVRAAIDAAHEGGRRAAVRVRSLEPTRAAVRAGADAICHGPEDAPLDDALLAEMRRRGVVYTASLVPFERFSEVVRETVAPRATEKRFGDPDAIRSWDDVRRIPRDHLPDPAFFPDIDPTPALAANVKRAVDARVTVAVGTSSGNIGVLHGPAIHRELELLARAGLTPAEVLAAATRGGAEFLGRAKDLGTLEIGKLADFVVLDADPLKDAAHLARVVLVVKGGIPFDPAALVPSPPR